MTILLSEIWRCPNPEAYKLHFARWNGKHQPLEVFARDKREWQGWQEYWPGRDDFNRPHIYSLIQIPGEADKWLFGGVFDVVARHAGRYDVALDPLSAALCGRLKLASTYRKRTPRVNFENHYADLVVAEILPEPYSGQAFPGYEGIDLSFEELETLVRNDRPDWKAALGNAKGIYLITDSTTGKRYVGSASGAEGIWSRWCSYAATGHGGNKGLRELVPGADLEYCRRSFRLALLEHRTSLTPDETVLAREDYWKRILLTRGDAGLNRN